VVQRGHHLQDEVLRAFVEVFVTAPGIQIAQNFLDLAGAATASSFASIEEALGHLVK
jgi:hypothetical protein